MRWLWEDYSTFCVSPNRIAQTTSVARMDSYPGPTAEARTTLSPWWRWPGSSWPWSCSWWGPPPSGHRQTSQQRDGMKTMTMTNTEGELTDGKSHRLPCKKIRPTFATNSPKNRIHSGCAEQPFLCMVYSLIACLTLQNLEWFVLSQGPPVVDFNWPGVQLILENSKYFLRQHATNEGT